MRGNPLVWSMMVLLVILTIVFTLLVIHESSQITELLGGEGATNGKTITKLKSDRDELEHQITMLRAGHAARNRAIYTADLELGHYHYYLSGDKLLSGVASIDQKEYNGQPLRDANWVLTRDLLAMSVKDMESLKSEHDSDVRQKFPKLDGVIASRQNELQAILKKINDQEAALKEDQDRLNTQIDKLNQDKDKAEKLNREDYSKRATKIGQLEDKIRSLLELELHWLKDLEPQGQVLEVNPTSPHLIVNLGSQERVFPGLIFEVFQYDRGRYLEKGVVEVVEVKAMIATCRVLNVIDPKRFPISTNDYISNPIFSTARPKVVVVSGEFKSHNKEDLETFIRQTGAVVRDKLSPGVDFLVAGDRSDKDQDNAREYQVLAMSEAQLLKYVRREFRPKQ